MRNAHGVTTTVLAASVGLALAACGGGSSSESDASSTTKPPGSTSTTTSTGTAGPTPFRCGEPLAAEQVICFTQGEADVAVSGSRTITIVGSLDRAVSRFPGTSALPYAGPDGTAFAVLIGDVPATYGSRLPFLVRIQTAPDEVWVAGKGECSITVEATSPSGTSGSVSCRQIPATKGKGSIDASGTFTAAP